MAAGVAVSGGRLMGRARASPPTAPAVAEEEEGHPSRGPGQGPGEGLYASMPGDSGPRRSSSSPLFPSEGPGQSNLATDTVGLNAVPSGTLGAADATEGVAHA